MNYWLGVIGAWIFSDGLYSLILYLSADGHNGRKQTWARDHWLRVVRMTLGVTLVIMGVLTWTP